MVYYREMEFAKWTAKPFREIPSKTESASWKGENGICKTQSNLFIYCEASFKPARQTYPWRQNSNNDVRAILCDFQVKHCACTDMFRRGIRISVVAEIPVPATRNAGWISDSAPTISCCSGVQIYFVDLSIPKASKVVVRCCQFLTVLTCRCPCHHKVVARSLRARRFSNLPLTLRSHKSLEKHRVLQLS